MNRGEGGMQMSRSGILNRPSNPRAYMRILGLIFWQVSGLPDRERIISLRESSVKNSKNNDLRQ